MKKRIPLIIILIVAIAGIWYWQSRRTKTDAADGLTLYGNVDIREVNLGFRVTGRVNEVLKTEGDPVAAGDVLARLDSAPYQRETEQVSATLAMAEADLKRLTTGYRPEEIAQARASVNELEATLANIRVNADRATMLLKENAIAQQEYDNAQTNLVATDKRLQSAHANLTLMEAGYRDEDVAKAKAQAEQARASLEAARIRLDDTVLRAPSSGTILTRALEPGAIVQPGATVLTLSLDNPVWVRAYAPEPELGKLKPGASVEVYTDSRPGRPYHGQIGYISPRAEFTPKTVQTEDLRTSLVFRLRIIVTDPDEQLRQGMPVTVKIK